MKKSMNIKKMLLFSMIFLLLVSLILGLEFQKVGVTVRDYETVDYAPIINKCTAQIRHINGTYLCTKYEEVPVFVEQRREYTGVAFANTQKFEYDGYFCRVYNNQIHCKSLSDGVHKGDEYATSICNNKGGESCMIIDIISNSQFSVRWGNSRPIYQSPLKYEVLK